MPVESATYIADLTPANPLGSDQAGQGDDHLRLIKSVLLATFPNMAGVLGTVRSLDTAQTISSTWNTARVMTSASATATVVLTLPNNASITAGWSVDIQNLGNFTVITPQAGSINGAATFTLPEFNAGRIVFLGGTQWRGMKWPGGTGGAVFTDAVQARAGLHVDGALSISGAAVMSSTLAVAGAVSIGGATLLNSTLIVNGAVTVAAGQIGFPAVQNPSANANVLDDYEEGTWTPSIRFAVVGNSAIAYGTRVGEYVKIGRQVSINFNFNASTFNHTTASGDMQITGLPFTSSATCYAVGCLMFGGLTLTGGGPNYMNVVCLLPPSAALMTVYLGDFTAAGGGIPFTAINHTNTVAAELRSSLTYNV